MFERALDHREMRSRFVLVIQVRLQLFSILGGGRGSQSGRALPTIVDGNWVIQKLLDRIGVALAALPQPGKGHDPGGVGNTPSTSACFTNELSPSRQQLERSLMKREPRTGEDPPPPRVIIRLLGAPQITIADRSLDGLRSRKANSILYLLAVHHDHPLDRRWIADQLWPDSLDEIGLDNLRRTLHDLRKALGEEARIVESVGRSALALRLEGVFADVVLFDHAAASSSVEDWKQAVDLFAGPLLDGEREEWVFEERRRRDEACLGVLGRLALDARRRNAPTEAAGYLRQAARMSPYSEETHRDWLDALDAAGNYAEAISVFRQFRRRLEQDLQIDAGPELHAVFNRVRRHAQQRLEGAWR